MDRLIENLKKLKQIQPDAEYSQKSKMIILASPLPVQKRFAIFLNWKNALALAGLLFLLISGTIVLDYFNPNFTGLDTQSLQAEQQNIDIQLAQMEYRQKSDETISIALKEIDNNSQLNHLHPWILESEKSQLELNPSENQKEIDNLLNQILL